MATAWLSLLLERWRLIQATCSVGSCVFKWWLGEVLLVDLAGNYIFDLQISHIAEFPLWLLFCVTVMYSQSSCERDVRRPEGKKKPSSQLFFLFLNLAVHMIFKTCVPCQIVVWTNVMSNNKLHRNEWNKQNFFSLKSRDQYCFFFLYKLKQWPKITFWGHRTGWVSVTFHPSSGFIYLLALVHMRNVLH